MTRTRPWTTALLIAGALVGRVAFGKGAAPGRTAPPSQGRACDAKHACDGGLACVDNGAGKATCEIVCGANTKCPEDQRCVKDGPHTVCRAITDLTL